MSGEIELDLVALREAADKATPGPWVPGRLPGHLAVPRGDVLVGDPRDVAYAQAIQPDVLTALLDRLETAEEERDDYAFQATHSAQWQYHAEAYSAAVRRVQEECEAEGYDWGRPTGDAYDTGYARGYEVARKKTIQNVLAALDGDS